MGNKTYILVEMCLQNPILSQYESTHHSGSLHATHPAFSNVCPLTYNAFAMAVTISFGPTSQFPCAAKSKAQIDMPWAMSCQVSIARQPFTDIVLSNHALKLHTKQLIQLNRLTCMKPPLRRLKSCICEKNGLLSHSCPGHARNYVHS